MNVEMRSPWRLLGIAGVVLVGLASLARADDANEKELKRLEGKWKFVSLTVDGDEAPQDFIKNGWWSFRGREITMPGPNKEKITFEVDPSRSPRTIDLTGADGPSKGKKMLGIYKLQKGRLTICFSGGKRDSESRTRP